MSRTGEEGRLKIKDKTPIHARNGYLSIGPIVGHVKSTKPGWPARAAAWQPMDDGQNPEPHTHTHTKVQYIHTYSVDRPATAAAAAAPLPPPPQPPPSSS